MAIFVYGQDLGGMMSSVDGRGVAGSSTELVSVVFTDLVDSTAIASRLGREAAEDLRKTHFALLRSAVAAAGGIEVKNLGDGLMVAFPSPSRAVACAVGMQQRGTQGAPEPAGLESPRPSRSAASMATPLQQLKVAEHLGGKASGISDLVCFADRPFRVDQIGDTQRVVGAFGVGATSDLVRLADLHVGVGEQ